MDKFITRETTFSVQDKQTETDLPHITGYFARFDDLYQLGGDMAERIHPAAFSEALQKNDIRALINHDKTLVLGRKSAGTLSLSVDENGLFGDITINPDDQDAMNLYARVKRGDVSQCSIGFIIQDESETLTPSGGILWTLNKLDLFEVSVCTFPAYEKTHVEARAAAWANKNLEETRNALLHRLKVLEDTDNGNH